MDSGRGGDGWRRRRPIRIELIDAPEYDFVLATCMTKDQITIPLNTVDKVSMNLRGREVWIVYYGRLIGSSVFLEVLGHCPRVDPSVHTRC